jgi:hypothetical protein
MVAEPKATTTDQAAAAEVRSAKTAATVEMAT